MYCDFLGNKWYNKCWRIYLPKHFFYFGETVGKFFPLLIMGLYSEIFYLFLYLSNFSEKNELLNIFRVLHRLLVVPLSTILGLYLVFKQRRPCGIPGSDNKTFGPLYGMPSGDSLASCCLATAFFRFSPITSLIFGLFITSSRVFRGFHSILQVIIGGTMGIIYGLLCVSEHPYFIFCNWIFSIFLPLLVLFDKNMAHQEKNNFSNYTTWLLSNSGMWIFEICCLFPEQYDPFTKYDMLYRILTGLIIAIILRILQMVAQELGWAICLRKK